MRFKDDEALNILLDRLEMSRGFVRPYHDVFNEIYELYRAFQDPTKEVLEGEIPNYVIPYIYEKVETRLPRIIQAIVGLNPFFKVRGVEENDKPQAENNQVLLEHQLRSEVEFLKFMTAWWKQSIMYGTSFAMPLWEKESKMLKQRFPRTPEEIILGVSATKKEEKVVYDGHDLRALDIFDCFPAPYGTEINGRRTNRMPWFIVREEVSTNELEAMMEVKDVNGKSLFKVANIKEVLKLEGGAGDVNRQRRQRLRVMGSTEPTFLDKVDAKYEMHTMWMNEGVVSVIDNWLIRNSDNPFDEQEIPIIKAVDTVVPGELFGVGVAAPLIKTNYYMNDLINLELQNLQRIVNPGIVLNVASGLNVQNFKEDPSGVHPINGDPGRAAFPIPMGSGVIQGKFGRQEMERLGDRTVGSDSLVGGQGQTRGDATLGEIERRLQQANIRFNLSALYLSQTSLKPLVLKMIQRNAQFMPQGKRVRIFNPQGEELTKLLQPDDIQGNLDVKIKMAPLQGQKQLWASRLMEFLKVTGRSGLATPALFNRIGQALELEDIDELLKDPAKDALRLILQAAQQGALRSPQALPQIISQIIQTLAPPGSENAEFVQSVGGGEKSGVPGEPV